MTKLSFTMIVALTVAAAVLTLPAAAQAQTSPKVGVVNPAKVLQAMKEREAVEARLESEMRTLQQSIQAKGEAANKLKAELDQLKPDSPQYAEKRQEHIRAAMAAKLEQDFAKLQADQLRATQLLSLYTKIETTTGEVARERGLDLVLTQMTVDLSPGPELTASRVMELVARRNVLYAAPTVDITTDVAAKLDAAFAGGQ